MNGLVKPKNLRGRKGKSKERRKAEGRVEGLMEGRIASLLELLSDWFGAVPEEIQWKILSQKDLGILKGWFHKATKTLSIEEFQSSMDS
jgi:hypothetical protein